MTKKELQKVSEIYKSTFNTRLPKGVGNVKPEAWSLYLSF